MKIGFDAKRAFCNQRGLGNYSRNLIDQLVEFFPENEYLLFTPKIVPNILANWDNGKRLKTLTPQNFFWKRFHPLWRSFELTRAIKDSHIDLFHGLSHELPRGIENLKIKKIVTIHDLIFIRYPEYFPWIDRQVYKYKFQHSVKVADIVIAIGEQTKRDIVEFLNVPEEKICIHYQSCHPSFYEECETDILNKTLLENELIYKGYILNVGAFEQRKNQKNLIIAFKEILKQHSHLKLVLVGKGGQYLNECQKLIQSLNLQKSVCVLTNIDQTKLQCLYSGALLFSFPSFFEGFGIPIIEAMFSRLPVVTSHGSCFPEVAGPFSTYIDPYDPRDIARGMGEIIGSTPSEIEDKTSRSWEYVQRFHRKNTTAQLVDIYRRLIRH